jgi:hypothetical protein
MLWECSTIASIAALITSGKVRPRIHDEKQRRVRKCQCAVFCAVILRKWGFSEVVQILSARLPRECNVTAMQVQHGVISLIAVLACSQSISTG